MPHSPAIRRLNLCVASLSHFAYRLDGFLRWQNAWVFSFSNRHANTRGIDLTMVQKNIIRRIPGILLVLFVAIQLVPYGRDHSNPPVIAEPKWNSQETRDLTKRACFDCHSNETTWPWYSHVAPVSWLVQNDVQGGRRHLNFSEWNLVQRHAKDSEEQVSKGDMPPWFFLPMHPEAKLNPDEKGRLISGLTAMFPPGK